jgi:Na+/proline symporter
MSFKALDWAIFFIVPIAAWIIGNIWRQRGTWRGYFLAQGKLNTRGVAAAYFGANLTFTTIFLVLSEEGYRRGYWAFSIPVFWVLGTGLFVWCYGRLRPFTVQGLTLHQVLGETFKSPSLQRWASLWTIVAFVGTVGLEFYGGLRLLQWTHLPLPADIVAALLLAFTVSALTATGGFRGVATADQLLDVVTLIGIVILAWYAIQIFWTAPGNAPSAPLSNVPLFDNILFTVAMGILFLPFQFCTLDSWQRLGAWNKRNDKSPAGWLIGAGTLLALAYCVPIVIGIATRRLASADGVHPFKTFLDSIALRSGLAGIVFAGLMAAVFSTADELLNCCGLSLLFDVYQIPRTDSNRTSSQEATLVASGQFYTALFSFLAAAIAVVALRFDRKISDIAVAVFSAQVVFIFPLSSALFTPLISPRLATVARRSMLGGFCAAMLCLAAGWALKDQSTIDGAPVVAFIVAGLWFVPVWLVAYSKQRHEKKGE